MTPIIIPTASQPGSAPHAATEILAAVCSALEPSPDHGELLVAARSATGLDLKIVHVDEGWFRLGGLTDSSGRRIAADLEDWVMAQTSGDMSALFDKYGDAGYRFTRHAGRRIYLNAQVGAGPLDFVQVEIDEMQEMLCRPLFEDDHIPEYLDELTTLPPWPQAVPLTKATYIYRRATTFAAMPELVSERKGDPRLKRFVREWSDSSAGKHGRFSDHWVLRVVPYKNSDGEHVLEAKPMTSLAIRFPDLQTARESAVDYRPARETHDIDTQAGYPMAWYFLQVARHYAHYRCIVDVRDDLKREGGMPEADARIIDQWIDDPYNFH